MRETYSKSITPTGTGPPDYKKDIGRAMTIMGRQLDYGESILWLFLIAQEVAGAAVWTRGPILRSEGWVDIPEVMTGTSPYVVPAGVDYLLKEFWMSWSQPAVYQLLQGGETTCRIECDAFTPAPINAFQTGWTRSLIESIATPSTLQLQVKNVGNGPMMGKVWIIGLQKVGSYLWW